VPKAAFVHDNTWKHNLQFHPRFLTAQTLPFKAKAFMSTNKIHQLPPMSAMDQPGPQLGGGEEEREGEASEAGEAGEKERERERFRGLLKPTLVQGKGREEEGDAARDGSQESEKIKAS
jgi:hypothetical protein